MSTQAAAARCCLQALPQNKWGAEVFHCGSDVIRRCSPQLLLRGAGCRHSPRAGEKANLSTAAVTPLGVVHTSCRGEVLAAGTPPEQGEKPQFSTAAVTSSSCGRNLDRKQLHKHFCKESAKILGSMQRLCEATCCNKSPKRGGLGVAHLDH